MYVRERHDTCDLLPLGSVIVQPDCLTGTDATRSHDARCLVERLALPTQLLSPKSKAKSSWLELMAMAPGGIHDRRIHTTNYIERPHTQQPSRHVTANNNDRNACFAKLTSSPTLRNAPSRQLVRECVA